MNRAETWWASSHACLLGWHGTLTTLGHREAERSLTVFLGGKR